ncbi:MAG TPA: anaerobic glycerol-3-phosphate dehydrogenase subunit C [Pirellulaceae bacterium]|nr:anaerobic glycerol-3-phosphate dehydrogenase subunit C [Pirellulaceae bacterium]
MDQQRERTQADLRGLIAGEVHCSDPYVQMYATDGSIYQVPPLGVVRPRGPADVQKTVRYAAEQSLPIHARGAGTGLAGESLGPGIVIDFSQSMRRIHGASGDTVTVQPGVVLGQLNRYLAAFGKQFGPDPATGGVTTLGSVLALDNSGSHWLRYGSARKHIVSMQVVLADGTSFEASRHPVTDDGNVDPVPRRREIVRRLAELIDRERAVIKAHRPKSLVNRAGYHLYDVLADGQLDLARLLVGSEGTLALTTEATLRTEPIPKYRGLVLMFFDKLESAAAAAQDAVDLKLAACDLMDRRILRLARDVDPRYAAAIPRDAEAMLMVEQQASEQREVIESLQQVALRWQRKRRLAFSFHLALAPEEYDLFRRLARRVSPTLYRVAGPERPVPFVEDIAVPPASLPEFLLKMQRVLQTHQVTASFFAHAGHGQLHIRPFLNLADPKHQQTMQALASDLYEEVLAVGGTISGEHGCGLSRTWFVKRQFGPLYDVFREVKRIFDPANLLNPGKVVADVPQPLTKNLRPSPEVEGVSSRSSFESGSSPPPEPIPPAGNGMNSVLQNEEPAAPAGQPLELHLIWNGTLSPTADRCNGCGRCRTQSPDTRMCPIFRIAPAEEASPRAKANLMRSVISGELDATELTQDTLKSLADLCVNCHQCRLECPAAVDIPKLMVEAKAQYVAANGLDTTDWIVTRLDQVSRWASFFGPLANWALHNRTMRWILEKTVGIAQGRKLPRVASSSFMRRAEKLRLTKPTRRTGGKVLYFVDLYANWYDVQLAEAFVAIMQHHGISVYVPPLQQASGMARVSLGDVERARKMAARNVQLLADAVRQGYQIVATEPSAVLCLTHEYRNLLDDDDVALVAENTSEACTYLWRMHEAGKLELDFKPVNLSLGYHTPCHLKALEVGTPGEQLLRLVPGLSVRHIERGCSGMAGTYGLKRANYRNSLRAGWGLIRALRDPAIDLGTTECSACKMQMEQGTAKPTIHPLKILAFAYGLMPEIDKLLTARGQELTVT